MTATRVLIFGGRGQLGRELVRVYAGHADVTALDLPEVDISDAARTSEIVQTLSPGVVINAAAWTDVDGAEDQPDAAFRVNELGALNVAAAAAGVGAPVVYYSTDYVFGRGGTRPFREEDPIAPIGVYGRSKAAGEAATRGENPKHFIIRTAWLYGPGGNHFVEKILRAAQSRPDLRVVEDEAGSPTCTLDLAEATCALVASGAYGTYHVVNTGACSRFEYAREILRLAGFSTPVQPCRAADFPSKAERPAYSVLDTAKYQRTTGRTMRPWRDALSGYMNGRNAGE